MVVPSQGVGHLWPLYYTVHQELWLLRPVESGEGSNRYATSAVASGASVCVPQIKSAFLSSLDARRCTGYFRLYWLSYMYRIAMCSNVWETHLLSTTRLACLVPSMVSMDGHKQLKVIRVVTLPVGLIYSHNKSLDPFAGAMYIRSSSNVSISGNTSLSHNSAFQSGGENGAGKETV